MVTSRRAWILGAVALLGCSGPSPAAEAGAGAGAGAGEAQAGEAAVRVARPWYSRVRALDLTGDGVADSVRLEAGGKRPDSLDILLVLEVGGEEKHREAWGSSYELTLADSAVRAGEGREAFLRTRLDSVLARVKVDRLDSPSVRLMAEDSAILAGLEPRPEYRTSISYGYETTVRLAWDAPRARFVRLWSCC